MDISLTTLKVLVLLALGIGKFIIGVIPAYYIKRNNNGRKKIIISGLLCFGTGVILFEYPLLEQNLDQISFVISAGGFFLLYLANEIYNYKRTFSSSKQSGNICLTSHLRADEILPDNPELEPNVSNAPSSFTKKVCVSHFGMLLALMFVAGYNALHIGEMGYIEYLRQESLHIFITQFISAFWLGLELSEAHGCGRILIVSTLLYSGASALGVGIGILRVDIRSQVLPILNHFAKGMILYVALIEILPRERTRWHNSQMRLAGLVLFSSALCGCTFMTITYYYIYYTD